jgi:CRISPR system Cascade subunit CasE
MIASVYRLNRADCKELGLKDAYGLHKAVYSLFPTIENQTRDFLFADKGGNWLERQILILSERKPLVPEYGMIDSKVIPDNFLNYERYGFEIILNPTKRDKTTGKIIPIRGQEDLLTWIIKKAPTLGFQIDERTLQVQDVGVKSFDKDGAVCTHGTATFIGQLNVTDRDMFIKSFKHGIGRAKAFGFGLLQIIPLHS